ncbi:MAG: hypothetical protein LC799_00095 [Actinobacteria bacterium]|nr:hypothetical protein [Actinomycetota bacterium]
MGLPRDVKWSGSILVLFAPETSASGVGKTGFRQACWYRRLLELPSWGEDERILVHFDAVDYAASVWIDGQWAARHEGGYSAFEVNVTSFCDGSPHELVVHAQDDPLGPGRGAPGLATAAPQRLVPDHRDLADGVAGAPAPHRRHRAAADGRPRPLRGGDGRTPRRGGRGGGATTNTRDSFFWTTSSAVARSATRAPTTRRTSAASSATMLGRG